MSSRTRTTISRLLDGDNASSARTLIWQLPGVDMAKAAESDAAQAAAVAAQQPKRGTKGDSLSRDEQHINVLMEQQARIQELERQLESRPRQAYQQGFNEGQTAGAQQANSRIDPVLGKLAHSIQDLSNARKRHLIEAEEDAVKLALAIARRILHRELTVDPDSLLGVVKATVARVDSRDVHRIRLNPEDVPALQRHLAALNLPPRIELAPDKTLERGGVIVETSRGSMDASISSQLAEIEHGLVDLVRRGNL